MKLTASDAWLDGFGWGIPTGVILGLVLLFLVAWMAGR